jgi:LCP family protein required for cell wall assembly
MAGTRSPVRAFFHRYVIALGTATTFMVGGVIAVNYVIDRKLDSVHRVKVDIAAPPPEGANYLLIGSDTRKFVKNQGDEDAFGNPRDEGGQRSDTMMVVHVEPGAHRTLVVSIPRDLIVQIPGQGRTLINAAFNAGPDKVIETLKVNFNIEINHYLEVDFETFRGIVKAVGDVPVYVPYPARDWDSGKGVNPTGMYTPVGGCLRLDGNAALAYVRSRHLQYYSSVQKKWLTADPRSDLDRITRQQDFMRKIAGIAVQKSLNNPLTANDVADRVLENLKIDQNLSKDDIFSLIDAFRTVDPNDPNSVNFQTFPNVPDNQNVHLLPKFPEAQTMASRLMDFSGDTALPTPTASPQNITVRVLNGSGKSGVAKSVLEQLVRQGFASAGAGNEQRGTIERSEVRYAPGKKAEGKAVLTYIKPQARLVEDPALKGATVAVVVGTDFSAIVVPGGDRTATTAAASGSSTSGAAATTTTTPPTTTAARSQEPLPPNNNAPTLPSESVFGKPAVKKAPC